MSFSVHHFLGFYSFALQNFLTLWKMMSSTLSFILLKGLCGSSDLIKTYPSATHLMVIMREILTILFLPHSFVRKLPQIPIVHHDPLPFVIPDASREGCYAFGERNFWFINLKKWQEAVSIFSLSVSPPRHLRFTKLLCTSKANTHLESWPVSAKFIEREASLPKLPPLPSA